MWSTPKTILNCGDRLDLVQWVRKIEHYNDAFNRTGAVYIENDIELWWPIELGVDCDKNNIGQRRVDSTNVVHAEHKTELSWLIKLDSIFDKK